MSSEEHELFMAMYGEEWLEYRGQWCDAVLTAHGLLDEGIFSPKVSKEIKTEALFGGLMLFEWVEVHKNASSNPKRL